jgi:hypothetical protein
VLVAAVISALIAATLALGSIWLDRSAKRALPNGPFVPRLDVAAYVVVLAFLREAHWAFFRTGTLGVGLQNTTLAVFIAVGLLALEAWSNPRNRAAFDDVRASRDLAQSAGLAVVSAMVFLVTGSTPACLVAHVLVALVILIATGHEHGRPLSVRRGARSRKSRAIG